jgi:hypothetical protein
MKFRKTVEVEAVQWFPEGRPQHVGISRVHSVSTRINYSADRKHYYITRGKDRPDRWMSVDKTLGEVPEERKSKVGPFGPYPWQVTVKSTGVTYWREVHLFSVWDIKGERDDNGRQVIHGHSIEENDELYVDYCVAMGWPPETYTGALFHDVGGRAVYLGEGDWVVFDENNHMSRYTPEEFGRIFTPIE